MAEATPIPDDTPDDVRALIEPHIEAAANPAMLEAISRALCAKRDEAKAARANSGIEQVWKDAEEAYAGIDDANRHEFDDAKWSKPVSMTGPVTTGATRKQSGHKSTVFVRLTARYVDAAVAKLSEILLAKGARSFSFAPMPVPDLIKAKENTSQIAHPALGPLFRAPNPGEPGGPPSPNIVPGQIPQNAQAAANSGADASGQAPQMPLTVKDLAEERLEIARKAAKAAEDRVYNWMVRTQFQPEVRKIIFDSARIGVGVLKGPVGISKRDIALTGNQDARELAIKKDLIPGCKWVDPWNAFPDPACGESIQEGDFFFERDYISERQLRDLKDQPGYIASLIDSIIEEGPQKTKADGERSSADAPSGERKAKGRYEIWYFHGALKREEVQAIQSAAGVVAKDDAPGKPSDILYVIVTIVNDRAIKAAINPLDSGLFPYHSFPWQRRAGHWAGIGVAEQVKAPQRICNAATRAMLNNAGKSAGSQFVVDRGAITPADGEWAATPDKFWWKTAEAAGTDVRQAFMAVEIPNVTAQLMEIVNYSLQMAEESTSIPLITQGQSGETTPETFGAAQIQNSNANQLLRSIGYAFDDYVTEPVVRQYYEWLLLDDDVPDEEKAEFEIDAHGSVSLVEHAIQDQAIAQMSAMALNPAYGIDPKKWAKLYFKSKRLSPEDIAYSDEEMQKIASNPPQSPQIAVANISAQVQREKIAAGREAKVTDATVDLHSLELKKELAMLEYANRERVSIAQVKADLAKTAMQLETEKELNTQNNAAADVKHRREVASRERTRQKPPVQAPGRAAPGHAFDQSVAQ